MKKLKRKLTNRLLTIAMVSVLITAVSISVAYWISFSSQVGNDLKDYGKIISAGYNSNSSIEMLKSYKTDNLRISLISSKGKVLYESDDTVSPSQMGNHLSRPEIEDAIAGGEGSNSRISDTLGKVTYYYAILCDDGNVIRVAKEIDSIIPTFIGIIPVVLGIIAYVLIISIIMASESTKKIVQPIEKMTEDISNVAYEELIPFANTIESQQNEIKNNLERIQLEKDKISALIANMSEGFILLDMNKIILMENDSAAILLHSIYSNSIGKNIIELSRSEQFNKCVNEAIEGKNSTASFEHNGKIIQVLASPVFSKDKQNGVMCLIMDITEKQKVEKIRREFTANVSHELKTPLTSISGYAEIIENGMAKSEDIQKFAGKIRKEAGRLVTLIGDIIELSQLDEPKKDIAMQYVNLMEIANECIESLSNSAAKNNISLNAEGEDAVIKGNREMLYEVIYNLCDNAIRYNKPDGSVNIKIKNYNDKAEITVVDTGIGIPQKHQKRIFERFYRVDKSHSKETGGTGLGLAIVNHIVERHNGNISLESIENQGTEIIVTLPK